MDIVYCDDAVLVCVKPAGVLSTDEPGGLPDLLREALAAEKPAQDIDALGTCGPDGCAF